VKEENKGRKYNKIDPKKTIPTKGDVDSVEEVSDKKELKKIVDNQPKKRKRNLFSRLVSGILGPEGISGIGQYVAEEILVPAVKNIVVDAVTSGVNMVMYGENKPRPSGHPHQSTNRTTYRPNTNYTSRYTSRQPEPAERTVARPARYGIEEYVIEDRFDASHVLTTLTENADMYDNVSVADYYDLIGVPSQYTDNTYGWTIDSIVRATIVPIRGGYIIKFPPVEVI
jgi:hypothetical protein